MLGESVDDLRTLVEKNGYEIIAVDGQTAHELGLKEYILKPVSSKSKSGARFSYVSWLEFSR